MDNLQQAEKLGLTSGKIGFGAEIRHPRELSCIRLSCVCLQPTPALVPPLMGPGTFCQRAGGVPLATGLSSGVTDTVQAGVGSPCWEAGTCLVTGILPCSAQLRAWGSTAGLDDPAVMKVTGRAKLLRCISPCLYVQCLEVTEKRDCRGKVATGVLGRSSRGCRHLG